MELKELNQLAIEYGFKVNDKFDKTYILCDKVVQDICGTIYCSEIKGKFIINHKKYDSFEAALKAEGETQQIIVSKYHKTSLIVPRTSFKTYQEYISNIFKDFNEISNKERNIKLKIMLDIVNTLCPKSSRGCKCLTKFKFESELRRKKCKKE